MYLLTVNPNDYKGLTIPDDESFSSHNCLRWGGRSKKNTWKPPKLIWQEDEDELTTEAYKVADITRFAERYLNVHITP